MQKGFFAQAARAFLAEGIFSLKPLGFSFLCPETKKRNKENSPYGRSTKNVKQKWGAAELVQLVLRPNSHSDSPRTFSHFYSPFFLRSTLYTDLDNLAAHFIPGSLSLLRKSHRVEKWFVPQRRIQFRKEGNSSARRGTVLHGKDTVPHLVE